MRQSQFLTVLCLLIYISVQAGSPRSISPNQRYIGTGIIDVDTSSTFKNPSATNWNPLIYTTTYPISLGNVTWVIVPISINDLYVDLSYSNKIRFYCDQ